MTRTQVILNALLGIGILAFLFSPLGITALLGMNLVLVSPQFHLVVLAAAPVLTGLVIISRRRHHNSPSA